MSTPTDRVTNMNDAQMDALNPDHAKWIDLDPYVKEAAALIGYTDKTWDPEHWDKGRLLVTPLVKEKGWSDLEPPQRDAAKLVGFNEPKWTQVRSQLLE